MGTGSGWMRQLGPRARAVRGGLHPLSALKIAAGRHDDVRLAGVRLTGPDRRAVANTAVEVAAGEYAARGFGIAVGERVVDVGANVGAFSVLAAHHGARVDAYEPGPETFAHLERNVAGLAVRCTAAAIVARPAAGGTVSLALDPDSGTRHRLGPGGVEVAAVPLSEAIGAGCDLLKLDCEGTELELLRETSGESLRRARRIACEVHPWAGDAAEPAARLSELGFETRVVGKRAGLALLFARR